MNKLTRRGFLGAGLAMTAASLFGKEEKAAASSDVFTPPTIAFPQKNRLRLYRTDHRC